MSRHHNPNQQRTYRRLLTPIVNTGDATCPRCGTPIHPTQPWDAGHAHAISITGNDHDLTPHQQIELGYVQAEHRSCNRAAGARLGNKQRARGGGASTTSSSTRKRERVLQAPTGTPAPVVSGYIREGGMQVRPIVRSGLVLPRIETPRSKGVRSIGGEVIREVNASGVLGGYSLLPWQEYALKRAFELRNGRLRWRTVIVTIGRQQGKSVLARAVCWWRIHQAERFGEPQLLLHTANKQDTAREVWRPAAHHALAVYGKKASKFGRGTEEIDLVEQRGRWLVQAATDSTGVGYSLSMGLIDEAWSVDRKIADESMRPAMSEREQPQLWLVSTAGDGSSDLLQTYRDLAIQDTDGSGDILLLEWSAPPEAAYDDPVTWRWASPHWSPRREEFLRSQLQSIPEGAYRTQYLNQWVKAVNAWIPATVWASCADAVEPVGVPDVVAVEESLDGVRYAAVAAWRAEEGRVIVRSMISLSPSAVWRQVEEWEPRLLLLPGTLAGRYHGRRRVEPVSSADLGRAMPGVARALADRQVLHDPADLGLTDDVSRAVAAQSDTMVRLSRTRSTGPIEACKALVWAVGELLKPAPARPVVRAVG